MDTAPTVELKNISKSFGRTQALNQVSLSIHPGEVVALLGDNGAGKSTLVRVIAGAHAPDSGELLIHGEPQRRWSPRIARLAGIETVYQNKALAERQTIATNVFMGREKTNRFGFIHRNAEREAANKVMRDIGFTSRQFDADSSVGALSGGERQGVAIARALYFDADIILLDEPTNALAISEVDEVLEFVQQIRDRGRSAVFITHNITHAHQISNRFVVMDRGEIVAEYDKEHIELQQLLEEMHGLSRAGRMQS